MNTLELLGVLLVALFVAAFGIRCMSAAYQRGILEGRRREASRQICEVIEEANGER